MILNISNNTDLVRFYEPWLIQRFKDGYFNIETTKQNNIYKLNPSNFELLVFQSKDFTNILKDIGFFKENKFNCLLIATFTPYSDDIEPGVNKKDAFNAIQEISKIYSRKQIIWKYAPIIINDELPIEFHLQKFEKICKKLSGYTDSCICDFIEEFEHPVHSSLYAPPVDIQLKKELLSKFTEIGEKYKVKIYSKNLKNNITKLLHTKVKEIAKITVEEKMKILDLGLPNTCKGGCEYCFCGGNKHFKNTNCIVTSPNMIGNVDTSKKHTTRKCPPLI